MRGVNRLIISTEGIGQNPSVAVEHFVGFGGAESVANQLSVFVSEYSLAVTPPVGEREIGV
jgi:hypothetical protein